MKTNKYCTILILFLFIAPHIATSQTLTLTDSLKAHYTFDRTTLDTSGNQNHLTNNSTLKWASFSGQDSAVYFDGNARTESVVSFDNSYFTASAIAMWVYVDSIFTNNVNVAVQGAFMGFGIYASSSNRIIAFFDPPYSAAVSDTSDISDGKWHHVVAQNNGDTTFLYVDGNFIAKKRQLLDVGNGSSNNKLYLGRTNMNLLPFKGSINDLRIYNRMLSQNEIDSLSTFPCKMTTSISAVTDVTCSGGNNGSITVSVDSGMANYNYVWSDSSTTLNVSDTFNTISGLTAGKYFVTITDTNSCSVIDSISISEPTALSVSINIDSLPSSNGASDGGLTASASGGTPAYTYTWVNSTTTPGQTGLAAGTYTVTVSDSNNCFSVASALLTEPDLLTCSTNVVNTSCSAGTDGSVTIVPAGGVAPYHYLWNNSDTTATLDSLTAGTYSVTLTDNNGITTTCSGVVTSPSPILVNLTSIDVSCNGLTNGSISASTSGGTSPYSYLWSNLANTSSISSLSAASYSVTVSDANGCTAEDSATINLLDSTIAIYDTLNASECGNYNWAQNNKIYSNSGFYRDTSLTVSGCDSIYHILDLTIKPTTGFTDTIIACDSIVWRDGVSYFSNNVSATDTLINSLGCDSIITLNLSILNLDLTVVNAGDSLYAFQAGNTYQWIDCGNGDTIIPGATAKGFKPRISGDFAVIIDNGACFDTSVCNMVQLVGLSDSRAEKRISVYPNPTNSQTHLSLNESFVGGEFTLRNLLGKVVLRSRINQVELDIEIQGSNGIYFLEVLDRNNKKSTLKLIKN